MQDGNTNLYIIYYMVNEIISDYKNIKERISEIIDVSGYKNEYVAKKIGLSPSSFSVKKSRKSFSLEEIEKIIGVIENEDVENFILLEILRGDKAMNEPTYPIEDLMAVMGWK